MNGTWNGSISKVKYFPAENEASRCIDRYDEELLEKDHACNRWECQECISHPDHETPETISCNSGDRAIKYTKQRSTERNDQPEQQGIPRSPNQRVININAKRQRSKPGFVAGRLGLTHRPFACVDKGTGFLRLIRGKIRRKESDTHIDQDEQ